MKNLLIMRHAKSDWSDSSLADIDRPLNKRGKKAAPFMGEELLKRDKVPDLFITSPAKRAKSTAEKVAEACGYSNELQFEKDFYFGYTDDIIKCIRKSSDSFNRIIVIGHNPTQESLIAELTENNFYATMPTAAIASLIFDINNWSELSKGSGKLEWILTPKQLMS